MRFLLGFDANATPTFIFRPYERSYGCVRVILFV